MTGYGSLRDLDSPSRLILAIPVFLLVRKIGINLKLLSTGAALGAIASGVYAYYQTVILNHPLPTGFIGSYIYFGQIALVLSIYSLLSLSRSNKAIENLLYITAAVVGLYTVLASGTRGGWIAIPTVFLFLVTKNIWGFTKTQRMAVIALVMGLLYASYHTPWLPVQERTDRALVDIQNYFQNDHVDSSPGHRFEVWKSAWMLAQESNFFGVGEEQFVSKQKELIASGLISPVVHNKKPHSQYFNSLAEQGALGLTSLLLLMLIPLKAFSREIAHFKGSRTVAAMGASTIICYLDFMLTQETLDRQLMVVIYAFVIAILYAQMSYQKRTINAPDNK